jgi:hypothetical protein
VTYLFDTNVISELRKGERAHAHVRSWYGTIEPSDIYLSALVLGEIRKGAEKCKARQPEKARLLLSWLERTTKAFDGRIIGVNADIALEWGRLSASRTIPVVDGLLAATAIVHNLMLVTRNVKVVKGTGAKVLNPYTDS